CVARSESDGWRGRRVSVGPPRQCSPIITAADGFIPGCEHTVDRWFTVLPQDRGHVRRSGMKRMVIRARGLGKRYRIGERRQYGALRDTVTNAVSTSFRRVG